MTIWSAGEIMGEGTEILEVIPVRMLADLGCEWDDGDIIESPEPLDLVMINKLLPIAPNESSVFCSFELADVDRRGDFGRAEPVKRPLKADTDLVWERTDIGEDLNVGSGAATGWNGLVVRARKPLNSGKVALLGVGEDINPCALMVNMTSMSPLGSFPSGWVDTPKPARIDLNIATLDGDQLRINGPTADSK